MVGSPLTASSSMTVAAGATVELAAGNGAVALLKTPSLNVSGKLDLQDNKLITQTLVGMWDGVSNYTGNLADVFTCIAALGETGCGFEHQFAAITRALGIDGSAAPADGSGPLGLGGGGV